MVGGQKAAGLGEIAVSVSVRYEVIAWMEHSAEHANAQPDYEPSFNHKMA